MFVRALFDNPRLLVLTIAVILVGGLSAIQLMPRIEDPVLTRRIALATTAYPGAGSRQVETLVTTPIETQLRSISGVKQLRSTSRSGVSNVVIELEDGIQDVTPVWERIEEELNQLRANLPDGCLATELTPFKLKAYALIVGFVWDRNDEPNYRLLRSLATQFERDLLRIPGTEEVDRFGDPGDEIRVEVPPEYLTAMGTSTGEIAKQIQDRNVQQPAGSLVEQRSKRLVEWDETLKTLSDLRETPIATARGQLVPLHEIAAISHDKPHEPADLSFVDGKPAVVVAAFVDDARRVDHWMQSARAKIRTIEQQLPLGIATDVMFAQSEHIDRRMKLLTSNLLISTLSVIGVTFLMLGWRSMIVVALSLPLSALIVLSGMRMLGIPIHQMSITGLIISLGLLIDNAIVITDETRERIRQGLGKREAISSSVKHLAMPLFGSTLTTSLSFAPIALLPGAPGEFVGSIAISVILAINASFLLAMTFVPALTGLLQPTGASSSFWNHGLHLRMLRNVYRKTLWFTLRVPVIGVAFGCILPVLGFLGALQLQEQFFPPTDREQIHIELELAPGSSITRTSELCEAVRKTLDNVPEVKRVHWFVGRSAPTFYYNVVPRRRNASQYGQAIVQLANNTTSSRRIIRELQTDLDRRFPEARILIRQLEQGPPFDAPVEFRISGPDLGILNQLSEQARQILTDTPYVLHTRAELSESVPKLAFRADPYQIRHAGLSFVSASNQMFAALNGVAISDLQLGNQTVPIRVSLPAETTLRSLNMLSLRGIRRGPPQAESGDTTVGAIGGIELVSDVAAITHLDGNRITEVKAYIEAGILPSTVVAAFRSRLENKMELPPGYHMSFGGESEERNDAVAGLTADIVLLVSLIIVSLVIALRSFRVSFVVAAVGGLSIGLGTGSLWCFDFPFGFMSIVGTMGLAGVAINDTIVVLAGICDNDGARNGDIDEICNVVIGRTRHVLATTLTTIVGFAPLILGGGGFWPPLAICIAGGISGATILALYFAPAAYLLLGSPRADRRGRAATVPALQAVIHGMNKT